MKRLAIAAALVVLSVPAVAADLRGLWNVTVPSQPGYLGSVVIDAHNRVRIMSPLDNGRPADFIGYVRQQTPKWIEIVLTDKTIVSRQICAIESSDLMRCQIVFADGRKSDPSILTRVGPGPESLVR